jgi:hypothetical protein
LLGSGAKDYQLFGQLYARHRHHIDVGKKQVNGPTMLGDNKQGVYRIISIENLIPRILQEHFANRAEGGFVFD